jgi:hypothetical protein
MEGLTMDVCADAAWAKLSTYMDLCTSHCGRPPIRLFGYEPPSADGFSLGYFLTPNTMQFCITHFDKQAALDLTKQLEALLDSLFAILSAPKSE